MEFVVESCVRGHHVYKKRWDASAGEELPCKKDNGNEKDPYAVAVMQRSTIVGHVPRKVARHFWLIRDRGTIIL